MDGCGEMASARYAHRTDSEGEPSAGPGMARDLRAGWVIPPDGSEDCSDDSCLGRARPPPLEAPAPATRQRPLPSFYIERLLQPVASGSPEAGSGSSSLGSSPASAGQPTSTPTSEPDWCVSPHCTGSRGARMASREYQEEIPASQDRNDLPALAGVDSNQECSPRSTPTRNVNAVFIAWPDAERPGAVSLDRLHRELMQASHPGLLSYGGWMPKRGPAAGRLVEFQPHQLDLSLASLGSGSGPAGAYFNVQGTTTTKRYRKQNRERKPRQAYSAVQLERLEDEFKRGIYLNVSKRFELAQCLGLSETQIKTWFQNRRTKFKKQQDARNKRVQRHHAQLVAQWLLQPGGPGLLQHRSFHPHLHQQQPPHQPSPTGAPEVVLLPQRPLHHLPHASLVPGPYLLPVPPPSLPRQRRTLQETLRINVPPKGEAVSPPARLLTPNVCEGGGRGRGHPEDEFPHQQDQC